MYCASVLLTYIYLFFFFVLMKASRGRNIDDNFTLIPKDHHRVTRGQVNLLFANACFAFLRLPETALVDGCCWGLTPYIKLIISYHHPRIKSGIIKCLRARAEKVCRASDITRKKEHLPDVFIANGYAEEMTRQALVSKEWNRGDQTEENETLDKLCIPYIRGLSGNMERH